MTAILDGNCHVPCGGTIEGLYLSVLDFEDRTLKTITITYYILRKLMAV